MTIKADTCPLPQQTQAGNGDVFLKSFDAQGVNG
jgi:hypothetical protein